ncbi:MAG: exo-alpha-sialidase [Acidimicrobiales bacterium]|nr:exo-alpha-sialidase [Acidimicrobiales bacterium]
MSGNTEESIEGVTPDLTVSTAEFVTTGRWRRPLLWIAAFALFGGAIAAVAIDRGQQDGGPVEVAVDEDLADEVSDDDTEEPSVPTTAAPSSSRFGGGEMMVEGPHGVVFDGERFVSLGHGPDGPSVLTSEDGIDWTSTPIEGLPRNTYANRLVERDGVFALIGEQWDDSEATRFFEPSAPTFYLGYSSDLANWTFSELPIVSAENTHSSIAGLGLTDSGVVVITQEYPTGPDEVRILFEAGILTEAHLGNYCGLNFTADDRIEVQLCDHEEEFFEEPDEARMAQLEERWLAAETDEEREAIRAELESLWGEPDVEVLAVIEPDEPLHAELFSIYHAEWYEVPKAQTLSGPIDGPFTSSPLPFEGHIGNVVQTQGRLVVTAWNERGSTTILSSTDGVDWSSVSVPTSAGGEVWGGGDVLLFRSHDETGGSGLFSSWDGGDSWTPADIPTSLFNTYPEVMSGPAGLVAVVNGAVEPFDYPEPRAVTVTRDGYSLTTDFAGENEQSVLTGPDGEVIYTLTPEEMYSDESDRVRMNPFSGTPSFLDPETGELLVSFRSEDYEAAYSEWEEIPFIEPEYATEVFYSNDGVEWLRLDDPALMVEFTGHVSPIAVGDDEAVFVKHVGPPAELFAFEEEGREPTDEELAALEQWEMQTGGGMQYIRVELP